MNSRVAVPGSLCCCSRYGQGCNDREPQALSRVIGSRTESPRGRMSSVLSSNTKEESTTTRRKRSEKEENHHYSHSEINFPEKDKEATGTILIPFLEGDSSAVGSSAGIQSGCLHNCSLPSRDGYWKNQPQQRLHPSSNRLTTKRKWMHLRAV